MVSRMGILTSAPVIIAAATIAFATSAAASPASFLDELATNGVALPGKTPDQTVAAGLAVCADLRGGASVLDEMSAVEQTYAFSQGTLFVSAASTNLCPDWAG